MIYYAKINDYWIKIGTTTVWERRRKTLEKHYKGQTSLKLLGVHAGNNWTERGIHAMFGRLRHGRTELFHPGEDLLRHIKSVAHPWIPRYDVDSEWDREAGVFWHGDELKSLEQLCEHNGTTLSRTIEEAICVFARSIGFEHSTIALGERAPHHQFGYEPPVYVPPPDDDEVAEGDDEDAEDVESRDEEEAVAVMAEPLQFAIEGGWG